MEATPNKIWSRDVTLEQINARAQNTMIEHLGIRFTAIGARSLTATMPVDHRTKQPVGMLHGGASVALAESIASTAGNLVVNAPEARTDGSAPFDEARTDGSAPFDEAYCVGLEINANHISSCTEGEVTGTSTAIHIGKTTQVWETVIQQNERLVCVSRMTLAVIRRKK